MRDRGREKVEKAESRQVEQALRKEARDVVKADKQERHCHLQEEQKERKVQREIQKVNKQLELTEARTKRVTAK